jgi:hypothetical protein
MHRKLIGGEFDLDFVQNEMQNCAYELFQNTLGTLTINGRSAFHIILKKIKSIGVRNVHLPSFMCDSILKPIISLNLNYSFYPVGEEFTAHPDPAKGDAVLLIHYFGWLNNSLELHDSNAYSDSTLIEDATHVYLNSNYSLKSNNHYTFLSLRKHSPTIMGGWCNLESNLDSCGDNMEITAWKSITARLAKALYLSEPLQKINPNVEKFYLELLRECEKSIESNQALFTLPEIVKNMIKRINWEDLAEKRRNNWLVMDELIGAKFERATGLLDECTVPLGYIIKVKSRDKIREKLAQKRIFAPIHWPLPDEVDPKRFPESKKLSDSLLTLPIDQRYNTDDIQYISETLNNLI